MKIRIAVAIAALLTILLPSPAMGAGIITDRPCYREGAVVAFLGYGFAPGRQIAVSVDGGQIGTLYSSPFGTIANAILGLPSIPTPHQTRTLTMTQIDNPALTTSVLFRETKVYVVMKPNRFTPGQRFNIRAGGFYGAGNTLYAHVRGPRRRNLRVGALRGPCGKVVARRKSVFRRTDRAGSYVVQFDTSRRYIGRRVPVGFRKTYNIRRVVRFSRASSFAWPVLGRDSWEFRD